MNLSQFFKPKPKVGVHHSYGLTSLGKEKAEKFLVYGVQGNVLSVLEENGTSSVSEIAEETRMSTDKIKSILKNLIRSGYVQRVGAEND